MFAAGIVAEYNPFHNGHKYHIEQTKKQGADHIVVILSGDAVQRGDVMVLRLQPGGPLRLEDGAVFAVQTQWFIGEADGMDGLSVLNHWNDDAEILFDDGAGLWSVDAVSEEAACAF